MLVHVPTAEGRKTGKDIVQQVLSRWTPPAHFFHFQDGGHVAACRHHLGSRTFAHLDIQTFFDTVTRSKVHRALRRLGLSQTEAWDITEQSTVRNAGKHTVPFGFVQSMALATAALDQSHLGRCFRTASQRNIKLSVYVDDIVLSGVDGRGIEAFMADLTEAALASGYQFNASKIEWPASTIEAFNIVLSAGDMRVSQGRMAQFETAARASPESRVAIKRYVTTVNDEQGRLLAGNEAS